MRRAGHELLPAGVAYEDHIIDHIDAEVVQTIQSQSQDVPLFLVSSHPAPHDPLISRPADLLHVPILALCTRLWSTTHGSIRLLLKHCLVCSDCTSSEPMHIPPPCSLITLEATRLSLTTLEATSLCILSSHNLLSYRRQHLEPSLPTSFAKLTTGRCPYTQRSQAGILWLGSRSGQDCGFSG